MKEIIFEQHKYLQKLAIAYAEQKRCAKLPGDVDYWTGKLEGITQGIVALELILNHLT